MTTTSTPAPNDTSPARKARVIAVMDGTDDTVPEAGAIVYWSAGAQCDRPKLARAWDEQGLDEQLLPPDKSPEVALREAVDAVCSKTRFRRPLRGTNERGWLVVEEEWNKGGEADWSEAARCTLDVVGRLQVRFPDAFSTTPERAAQAEKLHTELTAAYDRILFSLDGGDVTGWLVWLARYLRGVALREQGGVYFIDRDSLPVWRRVAQAVECSTTMRVEEITAVLLDGHAERTVRAVLRAVEAEAKAEMESMYADIAKADDAKKPLGKKALESRATRAAALREKVRHYAQLMGANLDGLLEGVQALDATISAATLIADGAAA